MTLSKRTQYALRSLICLADAYEHGYLQTREVAAREQLPSKFLESILSTLTRARFLASKIGANGGYRLARPPGEILIGDIIDRLEGKELLQGEHHTARSGERPGELAVRLMEDKLSAALREVVTTTSLATLAEEVSEEKGGQMYYI